MKVHELIEHLKMFGDNTDVFIQTTPNDLCQPISRKLISIIPARIDERSKQLEQSKVLLTAYIPYGEQK